MYFQVLHVGNFKLYRNIVECVASTTHVTDNQEFIRVHFVMAASLLYRCDAIV